MNQGLKILKRLRASILAVAMAMIVPSHADTARFVVFRAVPEAMEKVLGELMNPTKGRDEEAMASILERDGVKKLADLTAQDPWSGEAISLSGLPGDLPLLPEMDGKEVVIMLEGVRGKFAVRQWMDLEVRVAGKSRSSIRRLKATLPLVIPELGQWQELVRWNDAKGHVSVWQFSRRDDPTVNHEEDEETWCQFQVEFRGYQSARAIGKLDSSTPQAAEKTLAWLERGLKKWGEGVFCGAFHKRGAWEVYDDQIKAMEVVRSDHESVHASFSKTGRDLIVRIDVGADYRGKMAPGDSFEDYVDPGIWKFREVKGVAGVNLLAWRAMRVDAILGGLERAGSPETWTCQLHPDEEVVVAKIAGIRDGKVALESGGKTTIHPMASFSPEDRGLIAIWRGVTEGRQMVERGTAVYELSHDPENWELPKVSQLRIDFFGPRTRILCGASEIRLDSATGHFVSERKYADGGKSIWSGRFDLAGAAAWNRPDGVPPVNPESLAFRATGGFPGMHMERSCFARVDTMLAEAMVSRIDAPGLLAALRMAFDPMSVVDEGGKKSWPSPGLISPPWLPGSAGQLAMLAEAKVLPVAFHRVVPKVPGGRNIGTWKLQLISLDPVAEPTIDFPVEVLTMKPGTLKKSIVHP